MNKSTGLKTGIGIVIIAVVVFIVVFCQYRQEIYRSKLISEIKTRAEDYIRNPMYTGLIVDHVYLLKESQGAYFGFVKYKYPMPKYDEVRFGEAAYHSIFEVSIDGDIIKYTLNPPIDFLFFKSIETLGDAVGQN